MGGLMVLTDATYADVITVIETTLSSANLISVLSAGATAAVGLVLLWFSVRKVSGILMRAFKRGKLRL